MLVHTGITVFNAILQLLLISFAAGILVRKNLVSEGQVKALSATVVNIFLPCMIMAKTLIHFHPREFALWWILPLSGIFIVAVGLFFSRALFGRSPQKRPFMALAAMQNAIYIVLPIGQILFPDRFDLFALYCFLLVMGLNPVMWSLGKVMLAGQNRGGILWQDFFTPPLAAIFLSVAVVLLGLGQWIPSALVGSMDMLGQATVPLAVFVLGATMGTISLKDMPPLRDILIVTAVKFFLVPGTLFALLFWGNFSGSMPLVCSMLIIQACSPPATNLILIVKNYGGDARAVSSMMLIQYLVCIPAMPLWIAAWGLAVGGIS